MAAETLPVPMVMRSALRELVRIDAGLAHGLLMALMAIDAAPDEERSLYTCANVAAALRAELDGVRQ